MNLETRSNTLQSASELLTSHEQRINVVAVYPWSVRMPQEFLRSLKLGEDPSAIDVYLGQKPDDSNTPASGTWSPMRAYAQNCEDPFKDVVAAVRGDTTLYIPPTTYKQGSTPDGVFISDPYPYSLVGQARSVRVGTVQVLPPAVTRNAFTLGRNQEGLVGLKPLSTREFAQIIHEGQHEGRPVVESSAMGPADNEHVVITPEEAASKDVQLEKLCSFFDDTNDAVRRAIEDRARSVAGQYYTIDGIDAMDLPTLYSTLSELNDPGQPDLADLIVLEAVEHVRNDMFLKEYKKRGVEDRFDGETTEDQIGMRLNRLRKHFNGGTFGVEVLEQTALESMHDSDKLEKRTVLNEPTGSYEDFNIFWASLFTEAMDRLNDTSSTQMTLDSCFPKPGSVLSPDQEEVRRQNLSRLTESMKEVMAEKLGKPKKFVNEAIKTSRSFLPYVTDMAERILDRDKEIASSPDPVVPELNVPRAQLAGLYYYSRIHPDPIVRFEANRQLFLVLKTIFAKEVYDPIMKRGSEVFMKLVEDFFGDPTGESIADVSGIAQAQVRTKNGLTYGVDVKQPKFLESVIRKSMMRSVEDIHDFFSIGVVRVDDGTPNFDHIVQNRLTMRLFIDSIKDKYPDSRYEVTISGRKIAGTENFLKALTGNTGVKEDERKRAGSHREAIIRDKMIVRIFDKVDRVTDECEFNFYPVRDLNGEGLSTLRAAGFMGWSERLKDDEGYGYRRLVEDMKGMSGMRSQYEMLRPSALYDKTVDIHKAKRQS
jgi:hypothetical protein